MCYNKVNKDLKYKIVNEYIKKYIGGLAFMLSVLFLLIGLTQYNKIITGLNNDINEGAKFIKTSIFENSKLPTTEKSTFSLKDDGEIIRIAETDDGKIMYHYREIEVPELKENYTALPILKTEVIVGDSKKMEAREIYKINREKGLIYFLLKLEKNHQVAMTRIYTGVYEVELIK